MIENNKTIKFLGDSIITSSRNGASKFFNGIFLLTGFGMSIPSAYFMTKYSLVPALVLSPILIAGIYLICIAVKDFTYKLSVSSLNLTSESIFRKRIISWENINNIELYTRTRGGRFIKFHINGQHPIVIHWEGMTNKIDLGKAILSMAKPGTMKAYVKSTLGMSDDQLEEY